MLFDDSPVPRRKELKAVLSPSNMSKNSDIETPLNELATANEKSSYAKSSMELNSNQFNLLMNENKDKIDHRSSNSKLAYALSAERSRNKSCLSPKIQEPSLSTSTQLFRTLKKFNNNLGTSPVGSQPMGWEKKLADKMNIIKMNSRQNIMRSYSLERKPNKHLEYEGSISSSIINDNKFNETKFNTEERHSKNFNLLSNENDNKYRNVLPMSNNNNFNINDIQRQMSRLSKDLEDRSKRWDASLTDFSRKLEAFSEQMSVERVMEKSKQEREDFKSFEELIHDELSSLHKSNDQNFEKFKSNIISELHDLLTEQKARCDAKIADDIDQISDIKEFFQSTLPEIKNKLNEGRRKRKELNDWVDDIVNKQSTIWLEVLDSCQSRCELLKSEMDKKMDAFVDQIIYKIEKYQ